MNQLTDILIQRLEKKGLSPIQVSGFVRDVVNSISDNCQVEILQINRRLHLLGWEPIELDDHTLELIIAGIEAEGASDAEIRRS